MRRLIAVLLVIALQTGLPAVGSAQTGGPAPAGQMARAVHFTLAPRWLDHAESEGSITPFLTLYAIHGAMPIFAPIWEDGLIRGVGPRVEEPALALIPAFPYSAPYEEVRLKP